VRKLLGIGILLLLLLAIRNVPTQLATYAGAQVTLVLGFLLLASYLVGSLFMDVRLPGISGYMVAGIVFGPYLLGFINGEMISQLKFIDDLALTFIALEAGAELRLADLRPQKRSLFLLVVLQLLLVFAGVTLLLFLATPVLPIFANRGTVQILVICLLIGALAVARSPSSAVAIIDETHARGPFTELTLGVTVTTDLITIVFFGVILSVGETLATPGQSFALGFVLGLLGELLISMLIGYLVGLGLTAYVNRTQVDLPIILLGVSFLIKKLSDYLGLFLKTEFGLGFHLEPLIIAVVAGVVVRNFSRRGEEFIEGVERSSLPVFVLFFTLIGTSLNIEALRSTWLLAMIIFLARLVMMLLSSYLAGRMSGDSPLFSKMYGLAFIAQAGVSLGLALELNRRFPEWGSVFAAAIIASITINQLVGPVAFKYALDRVGETRQARSATGEE
jgi:Kef-type K+ transport system membrane component KefB